VLKKKFVDCFAVLALGLLSTIFPAVSLQSAEQNSYFQSKAKQIYMIEAESGSVLLSKDETDPVTPASLSKLMTVEYVLSEIKAGNIAMTTEYPVSENAWRTGGALSQTSTMFAALNSKVPVSDLLKGVIVPVANDGCIILAEGLAGSEAEFAKKLNQRAKDIGLTQSTFVNATGLPAPGAQTTMQDMVILARHLVQTYPETYPLYAMPDFEWNKIKQRNRNPLISQDMDVDGLVTGFAEESGYGIVASISRDGTRLILAMSGLASEKERLEEAKRVLEWGVSSFQNRKLFDTGEVIASVSVFGGLTGSVDLVSKAPVNIFMAKVNPDRLSAQVTYRWPLKAPVKKGQQIGTLDVKSGDRIVRQEPLYAGQDVGQGGLTSRAWDGLIELAFFWL
jgi:D-alanyl-D-alanine carboxypeptidase (penicillin-binding protein 5/6)